MRALVPGPGKPSGYPGRRAPGLALAAVLAGCAAAHRIGIESVRVEPVTVPIAGAADPAVHGFATLSQLGESSLRFHGRLAGLAPGKEYGFHVRERGSCADPKGPGPHFDPYDARAHGSPSDQPGVRHAGDLPNLSADADGVAAFDFIAKGLSYAPARNSLAGRTLVVDSGRDDFLTQPDGGSGPPLACGAVPTPP